MDFRRKSVFSSPTKNPLFFGFFFFRGDRSFIYLFILFFFKKKKEKFIFHQLEVFVKIFECKFETHPVAKKKKKWFQKFHDASQPFQKALTPKKFWGHGRSE